MDFFAAQDDARRRTGRLVILFGLAVVSIVALISVITFVALEHQRFFPTGPYAPEPDWGYAFLSRLDTFALIAGVTLAVVGGASLIKWAQVRSGGRVVAESLGGTRIDPSTTDPFERRLMNVVEEMAIASGIPLPDVYVMRDEDSINAFAAGLTTSDAVVAVTQGCLEKLNRDELQGVIAHEIGHVLNGDMKLNLQLMALLYGIFVFTVLGKLVIRSAAYSSRSRGSSRDNAAGMVAMMLAGATLFFIGHLGFFFGRLIQAGVSRQREYLADASAVQFTRNPRGIAGALKKIGGFSRGSKLSHPHATEISHSLFAQGFRSSFIGLLATHPPLDRRIRVIDPSFDGAYVKPPSLDAALHEMQTAEAQRSTARFAAPGFAATRAFSPERALEGVGTIPDSSVERARDLRERIPPVLLDAAHGAASAPALVFGLLLARDDARLRDGQLALLARHGDASDVQPLMALSSHLANLDPSLRLPLVQVAIPSLHSLTGAALDRFLYLIHELVHFDGHVDAFEFAVQKMLVHHLRLAAQPTRARVRFHSLPEVAREVGLLLSALAHLAGTEEDVARSFSAGLARLPSLAHQLTLAPRVEGFDALHDSLEALEQTTMGIRKEVLDAAAHTIGGDGRITVEELDILRAVASVLDCPMPLD